MTAGGSRTPPARIAMITGAGRGIGRTLAYALSGAGLAVGLVGRSEGTLEEVARDLRTAGVSTATAVADVRVYEEVVAAAARIESGLGGIDLLINNAGVIEPVEVPVWEADPQGWWDVVETDLRGPFHCVRAVVPGMVSRGGGRVIDLNSGAGAADRAIYSAYCAAKAGLFRIGGNLHLAGFQAGLRAFELSPGVIQTEMTAAMGMHADRVDWTAPEAVVDLVLAIARGDLDAWSGCYLRAGVDTPASLALAEPGLTGAAASQAGAVLPPARRLGIFAYGPQDPLNASG